MSPLKAIDSYVPESLVDPFAKNAIIPVVLLALFAGAAMRKLKDTPGDRTWRRSRRWCTRCFRCACWCWGGVIHAVPFAVFGVVAQVVGRAGLDVFAALIPFLGIVLAGMVIHALLYYPAVAWFVSKKHPKLYLGVGADAILTVSRRKKDRLNDAIRAYHTFADAFSEGDRRQQADRLHEQLTEELQRLESASAP